MRLYEMNLEQWLILMEAKRTYEERDMTENERRFRSGIERALVNAFRSDEYWKIETEALTKKVEPLLEEETRIFSCYAPSPEDYYG